MAVWSLWAVTVATIVLARDNNWITAGGWLLTGLMIGMCTWRVLGLLSPAVFAWHERYSSIPEIDARLSNLEFNGQTSSDEYEQLFVAGATPTYVPPIMGLFLGTLIGSCVGAACPPFQSATASLNAALCAVPGIGLISAVTAAYLACSLELGALVPRTVRIKSRLKLLAAPLTVFPVACVCVRYIVARCRRNAA